MRSAIGMAGLFVGAALLVGCGGSGAGSGTGNLLQGVSEADIDIDPLDEGAECDPNEETTVCFDVDSSKDISFVAVAVDCPGEDVVITIDGEVAEGESGTGGNPHCAEEIDGVKVEDIDKESVEVCVTFPAGVGPGEIVIQVKSGTTCETESFGEGECDSCDGGGGAGGAGGSCPDSELTIEKEADAPACAVFGQFFEITYTYTVTNTGEGDIDDIVVFDSFNGGDAVVICEREEPLEPGDSFECEFDLEECADARICIDNEAQATGVDECQEEVDSNVDELRTCVDLCSIL